MGEGTDLLDLHAWQVGHVEGLEHVQRVAVNLQVPHTNQPSARPSRSNVQNPPGQSQY